MSSAGRHPQLHDMLKKQGVLSRLAAGHECGQRSEALQKAADFVVSTA